MLMMWHERQVEHCQMLMLVAGLCRIKKQEKETGISQAMEANDKDDKKKKKK